MVRGAGFEPASLSDGNFQDYCVCQVPPTTHIIITDNLFLVEVVS